MPRLQLPQVTLCAVTSVNVAATVAALEHSLELAEFGRCLLITDASPVTAHPAIATINIAPLSSAAAYSRFMLEELHRHIATDYVLVVQWDGFVLRPDAWNPAFLDCDYIGATWPQFGAATVGNGGFSLRSKRLLEACRDPAFMVSHPEDTCICRDNRELLETSHGIRFADPVLADRFSRERTGLTSTTFGFHGVFNMPAELGGERFSKIYRMLDDRGTIREDFWSICNALIHEPGGGRRLGALLLDRWRDRRV